MLNSKKLFYLFLALFVTCLLSLGGVALHVETPKEQDGALLYYNPKDDLTWIIHNAIMRAKKSIDLKIFSLTDPFIIESLNQKAEEGIPVTIIYDKKNSYNIEKRLNPKIRAKPCLGIKGIMHRKILIIDNEEVWFGSTNFTTSSLEIYPNLLMGIHCKELANNILSNNEKFNFNSPQQSFDFYLLPSSEAKEQITRLLNSAKKTIKVAMFTWSYLPFAEDLLNAKKRGVDVEVILDSSASKGASKIVFQKIKNTVPVRLSNCKGLMHHKFAYIDSSILIHGSANWTKSAFEKNEDCLFILYNLNNKQKELIDQLFNNLIEQSSFN